MADALVKLLNSLGYQPVLLPVTGLRPPELYNYAKVGGKARLVRRGPLRAYLPDTQKFKVHRSSLADISHRQTSKKGVSGAIDFLGQCLQVLGAAAVPQLDLSFTKTTSFVFSFVGVSSLRVEPSEIDFALEALDLGAIPDDYADQGFLHAAYDYAFASSLNMQRSDGKAFASEAKMDIAQFIQTGAGVTVSMQSENTVSFKATGTNLPVFAYKAGQLVRDERWHFYPEETYRSDGETRPFVMRRGAVLEAV